jgi:hypothetical protein
MGIASRMDVVRAVFTHGPKGPGPRAANFQGRHIKKNRDWSMVCEKKKGCPRERNLRDIYTENSIMFCLLSVFCVVSAYTYEQIRGRAKFSWAQGRKIPKYGPGCSQQNGRSRQSEIATHHVTRHNTPIHNILSTAPQLSISQKALGTLPEDGNVMPKHVGATIHN